MELEDKLKKNLPAAKQAMIAAVNKAAAIGVEAGHKIKAGFHKIDRFFASTAEIMRSESTQPWTGI